MADVSVTDVQSAPSNMPFLNRSAWKNIQQSCSLTRRAFAHLSQGTRPGKKEAKLKSLRSLWRHATINREGLLVVCQENPYWNNRKLIVIPT